MTALLKDGFQSRDETAMLVHKAITIEYNRSAICVSPTGLFRTNLQYFVGDFSQTACYAVYN